MYQALTYYISNLTQTNGINLTVYNHFTSIGVYGKYGCWGLMESSDQDFADSPKFRAYIDFINSKKRCSWTEQPSQCSNNCSNAGVCTSSTSVSLIKDTCNCFFNHNGTTCENTLFTIIAKCSYKCGGRGNCTFDHYEGQYEIHTCHCETG